MKSSWADAPSDSSSVDVFITRLIDMIDELVDDINKDVGLTESELDWIKHDIKMWLEWKLCSEQTKDEISSSTIVNNGVGTSIQ